MTKSIDPRLAKIVKWQSWLTVINAFVVSAAAISISNEMLGWSFGGFCLGLALAWVGMKVMNAITLFLLQVKYYGFSEKGAAELAADAEDAMRGEDTTAAVEPEDTVNQVMLKIVNTPEKILGRFMDAEFYEWIDVAGEDKIVHRFSFTGTIDMSRGVPQKLEDGCILLPPGILYQVDTPINNPT